MTRTATTTTAALHFVGFRSIDQIERAARIFGRPDFLHYVWDIRAARGGDHCEDDTYVFARGCADDPPSPWAYDDSARA